MNNYKRYYDFVNKREVFNNGKMRIIHNFVNLGFWIVKDSQKRITLNFWKIRLQF